MTRLDPVDTTDFNADGYACDEQAFYAGVNGVALLELTSFNDGAGSSYLEFFVSTDYAGTTTEDYRHCALARVVVEPGVNAVWTWYTLDREDATTVCRVDGRNLAGVSTSAWGEEAFIWGPYTSQTGRLGGVCAVDVEDPTLRTTVMSPEDWQLSIGDVAPHPWVSDLIAVAPLLEPEAWAHCHLDGEGDCPDAPRVLLGERTDAGWTLTQVASMPPSLVGGSLAWTEIDESGLVYGTSGSGTWRGTLTWE